MASRLIEANNNSLEIKKKKKKPVCPTKAAKNNRTHKFHPVYAKQKLTPCKQLLKTATTTTKISIYDQEKRFICHTRATRKREVH